MRHPVHIQLVCPLPPYTAFSGSAAWVPLSGIVSGPSLIRTFSDEEQPVRAIIKSDNP